MKLSWIAVALLGFIPAKTGHSYETLLTFDAVSSGTILDKNGAGTSFTHRLPGTGAALPTNDPNLDILTTPGRLLITSTKSDINQSNPATMRNLDVLEAPGLLLNGISAFDIAISALFLDVSVPNPSDQLELYAAVSSELSLRAGMHHGNIHIFTENQGVTDVSIDTGSSSFATGDDILLTLQRASGLWSLKWQNLTNPAASGSLPPQAFPALDASNELYVGVIASNPGTNVPFLGQIDYFSVSVTPEPHSLALLVVGVAIIAAMRRTGIKAV